ncbi:glycosyltransferase family 1 protein [Thiobacillus sp.]|uniref:glycosyltransferase family 4 protein n=1 Tax=Thiobacillus sp. TaxID=924 RepID=UPI00286E544B|nr:glycosyltransferase family 1 protein [Thiobacillus sp.]
MRIAFTLIGGKDWTGGYNYLLNLLHVLGQHQQDRLTPVLFVGEACTEGDIASFAAIPGVELVRTPLLNAARRTVSLIQAMLLGQDASVRRLFQDHQIDVVFESAQFFGWRLGTPAIAWIPDFQHKVLPHLFSRSAWWKREIGFRAQVLGGRIIMLSSEDARRACEQHYPSTRGRTRTVHFAVPPGPRIQYSEARGIADSYGLPEQYFFMPNQFWRHKNHGLVLEALIILRQRGGQVVVAASGKQADPRAPDYFPAFRDRLEQAGMQDMFRLLGMIPYPHLASLMRASTALLNPSLFEGWSTTVEEARSMGTPMLLSDLDVHREQMGENARYFDRHSAQSLADALDGFVPLSVIEREQRVDEARAVALQRVEQFALDFVELAGYCQSRVGRT